MGKHSNKNYLHRYGLTEQQVKRWIDSQGQRCAVCGGLVPRLNVDHNHVTGETRGMVCTLCNTLIGYLENHPTLVETAAEYIRRHKHDNK